MPRSAGLLLTTITVHEPNATIPPGWTDNPSRWSKRLPLLAVAFLGLSIATYLTLYQLGVFSTVWEPFFQNGSERILHSSVSRLLPVPDAALGALGYLVDIVSGIIGGRSRWRTMPWIVFVFGATVGSLGVGSILLVIAQPLLFGAWCTLCLTSACISISLMKPAIDEVRASVQHLKREKARGSSFWRAFWGTHQRNPAGKAASA